MPDSSRISPRMQAQLDALEAQGKAQPSGDDLEAVGIKAAEGVVATPVVETKAEVKAETTPVAQPVIAVAPAEDYEKRYREVLADRARDTEELTGLKQRVENLKSVESERDDLKAKIAPLTEAQSRLEAIERENALRLTEDELTELGGEGAVKAARKLAEGAVAIAEKRLTEKFEKLFESKFGEVDTKVLTGVEKVETERSAKQRDLAFSNAVYAAIPEWASVAELNSPFQKYLDADAYKRRATVNAIFAAKDSSPEAIKILKEMVTESKGTSKESAKAEFEAPANTRGKDPKSTASAAGNGDTIDLKSFSHQLRHRNLAEADRIRKTFQ